MGCPIRKFPAQCLLAAPRNLSQRATSFIASQCQGIHQMPFRRLILTSCATRRSQPTGLVTGGTPDKDALPDPKASPPRTAVHWSLDGAMDEPTTEELRHVAGSAPAITTCSLSVSRGSPLRINLGHKPSSRCSRSRSVASDETSRARTHRFAATGDRFAVHSNVSHHKVSGPGSLPGSPPRHRTGGGGRDRTDDLMLAKHALSQLSYGPELG